jgi:hypothetical protein
MADLTRSNYTILDSWDEGDATGKQKLKVLVVNITSGTAGGTTNAIPASVFGLSEIYSVQVKGVDNVDPGAYTYIPDYAGENLLAINLEQGTDANRGDPADVAFATFPTKLIIKGKES